MFKLFIPPVFSDSEKTSKALLFFKVIIGSVIIISLVEAIEIIILPKYYLRWVFIILSFNSFCFVFLLINKKNYSRSAPLYFVSLLFAALFGLAWTAGGIKAPVVYNLPVVILLAGLLLGRKESIVTAIASIVGALGLVFADYINLLPISMVSHNPASTWISISTSVALITLLQYYLVANLNDSLNKANLELSLRKKIEEDLRSSEAFRWRVFESSRIPIVVMDVSSFRFIDCNQAATDIYRFSSREDTIGKTPLHVSPQTQYDGKPSSEKSKFYIEKALAEKSAVFEWKHQRPNGELWDAEVHLISFNSGDRKLLQFSLVDITERKRVETELRISEERFRLILENMPILLNAFDEDGKVIVWNKACQNATGYSAREIIGNPRAMELLYPDPNYRKKVWDSSLDPANKNNAYDLVTKNHDIRTIEWFDIYHSLTISGWASWGIGQDITDREQAKKALQFSEEKFRRAFVVSPDSININRLSDGMYVQINEGFTRIMGYEEGDIIGKTSVEMNIWKNVEDRQKLIDGLRKNGTVENLEAEFYAKDGSIKNGLMSSTIIDLNNEKHILSITRDISERKQVELELEIYRKQLEDLVRLRTDAWEVANEELKIQLEKQKEYELMLQQSLEKEKELSEMKSRFISTTSHEFRTPLTAVMSSAEMLQRFLNKWSEEKRNEHFERIKNSVVYLAKLLDDVLNISRTETGKLSYNPESIDLHDFAIECTQDAKSLMTKMHELRLNYNSPEKIYWFDRKLMKFIFNNLLSNAVKYSPEGGKVEMTIFSDEKYFVIEVGDEGIGIPIEESDKIFESFYRSKNAENISGTGLGLAIVKRAVDLHNGNIYVKSEVGKGATFTVKIPIGSKV